MSRGVFAMDVWGSLTDPETPSPSAKHVTWIQVKIPSLRANGLPSKRAVLQVSRAPKHATLNSEWDWNQSIVRIYTIPLRSCTDYTHFDKQYFLGAYLPSKFSDHRIIWGDRLWFQFDSGAISTWMRNGMVLNEPDTWFHAFLESSIVPAKK